jgi:hypothetical protein
MNTEIPLLFFVEKQVVHRTTYCRKARKRHIVEIIFREHLPGLRYARTAKHPNSLHRVQR